MIHTNSRPNQAALRRAVSLGTLLGLLALIVGPGALVTAAPAAAGQAATAQKGSDGKGARGPRKAHVSDDVTAAIQRGPVEAIVGFDAAAGIAKIESATARRATAATRKAGARAAAVEYSRTKREVLDQVGGGVRTVRDYDHLPIQAMRIATAGDLDRLAETEGVRVIQLPKVNVANAFPVALSVVHQPQAVASSYDGDGVGVAVLDTGVDWTLAGASGELGDCSGGPGTGTCRIQSFHDVTASGQRDVDPRHHGTNVSGIVANVAPEADLHVFGVFQAPAAGSTEVSADDGDILAALNYITRDGPALNIRSVNLSLGDEETYHQAECMDSYYTSAFLNLRALGIVPVVAAGNSAHVDGTLQQPVGVSSPACATGAIRVGAVYAAAAGNHAWGDCTDTAPAALAVTCFSQTGPLLSVYAPGVDITAAGITMSGTSQAAPFVAGAVADLVSANPRATAQQLARALTTSRSTLTDPKDGTSAPLLDIETAARTVQDSAPILEDAGCRANTLPANDDGSVGASLPFPVSFFGTTHESLNVNNNGNVTFTQAMSTFTPFTIDAQTPPIIAPFFADVDTRGIGSSAVTFGSTSFGSRQAFCVNWRNVGYYSGRTDKLNSFQLLLVDRGDVGVGDFDIVMNYDALTWETGEASGGSGGLGGTPAGAGYSAGDGDSSHFFQFPGSLTHLSLLDTNSQTGLANGSRGTLQRGRYVFPVRNGAPPGGSRITGTVSDAAGSAQVAAPVDACPETGSCVVGVTGGDGHFTILGVAPGRWRLSAMPPAGSSLMPARSDWFAVGADQTVTRDLVLPAPQPAPEGTTITAHGQSAGGLPVLLWNESLNLSTRACPGGFGAFSISTGGDVVTSGAMTEQPAGSGHYEGTSPRLYPASGPGLVEITIHCPSGPDASIDFGVYIDPSGTIKNTAGEPIAGATVTLYRSDSAAGPFEPVPDGSAIMSPSWRTNPMATAPDGVFHWDVLAGFYVVRASAPGCTVPGSAETVVSSAVLEVPPPALGIDLVLDCGESRQAAQSISFGALPDRVYGDAPVQLSATASSGLAVSFTSSGSCSVAGSSLTLTAAGRCTVTAQQAGDGAWQPAADLSRSFQIAQRELVVAAADQASNRGDPIISPLTAVLTGLVGSDSYTGQASCSTTATAGSEAGTYPITCEQGTIDAGPSYRLSFRPGSYVLLPAPDPGGGVPSTPPPAASSPSAQPTPVAPPAQPTPVVKVKADSKRTKFKVDVDPNKGRGYWRFKVQRKLANGSWVTMSKTYKTLGTKETRTINLKKGTYRVLVLPKYGFGSATSVEVALKR